MPKTEFSVGSKVSFTIRIPTIYEPRIVGKHAEMCLAECPYRGTVTKVNGIGVPLEITDNEGKKHYKFRNVKYADLHLPL